MSKPSQTEMEQEKKMERSIVQQFIYRLQKKNPTFMALITICCAIVSIGFIPSSTIAQNIIDNSEKIEEYSHYKTKVNGILMHYVIGGKGDPVVLLHGWPETWYEWRNIIPKLIANNYTVANDISNRYQYGEGGS
jgi:hypothetical protein